MEMWLRNLEIIMPKNQLQFSNLLGFFEITDITICPTAITLQPTTRCNSVVVYDVTVKRRQPLLCPAVSIITYIYHVISVPSIIK